MVQQGAKREAVAGMLCICVALSHGVVTSGAGALADSLCDTPARLVHERVSRIEAADRRDLEFLKTGSNG